MAVIIREIEESVVLLIRLSKKHIKECISECFCTLEL